MAKFSNVFSEAARRYRDFQSRGFIPEGAKYAYQDFVNEVVAENRGEEYQGAYTAKAYEQAYGKEVNYYESETYEDINESRLEDLLDTYREELRQIYNTNDFLDLAEQYGNEYGFDPSMLDAAASLDDLIAHARSAQQVEPYLFRNKHGRNRQTESDMMETYFDGFLLDLNRLIQEMNEQIMKFMY